uniref:Globin domain-containing protein n=1 Tax=Chromera velia CCMP2878 TaxID=1169474 RepID=A0A0G4HCC2_9ALVE|eukprot:Cvel_6317.t1-p1 / transcript=Cvel_6317.t1 / gene=Cvel_6317 / organism=Chromera_velia_CCMP2878 / gene_product=Flavohemoprotein, putative / transcript_product=Flavohemoprotein, putative / location=Cvel_scaffold306:76069-85247(+) / protein_length=639 / sequence_SO=supercontig / SO=protein_coding / is_pseudo=false
MAVGSEDPGSLQSPSGATSKRQINPQISARSGLSAAPSDGTDGKSRIAAAPSDGSIAVHSAEHVCEGWSWFAQWLEDELNDMLILLHRYAPLIHTSFDNVLERTTTEELGVRFYEIVFETAPHLQKLFKKPRRLQGRVFANVAALLISGIENPRFLTQELQRLSLRHVGYDIRPEHIPVFGNSLMRTIKEAALRPSPKDGQPFDFSHAHDEAWGALWGRVSTKFYGMIEGATNLITRALIGGDGNELCLALAAAPRGERINWAATVDLDTTFISPIYWCIREGRLDLATILIKDLLTIRADRARYYYGRAALFKFHPDLIEVLRHLLNGGDFNADFDIVARFTLAVACLLVWTMTFEAVTAIQALAAFFHSVLQMIGNIVKFMIVMVLIVCAFGSALALLAPSSEYFNGFGPSVFTLAAFAIQINRPDIVESGIDEISLLFFFFFTIVAVILMLNLLIAQITIAYEFVHHEVGGFARLGHAKVVLSIEACMSLRTRLRLYKRLGFDRPLEFDDGDFGPSGGVQTFERPSDQILNRRGASRWFEAEERVQRRSGPTGDHLPWPKTEVKKALDDKEKLNFIYEMIKKSHGHTSSIVGGPVISGRSRRREQQSMVGSAVYAGSLRGSDAGRGGKKNTAESQK